MRPELNSLEYQGQGKIVLLPGLGADAELFEPQVRAFGDRLIVPEWVEPDANDSIAEYALRWGAVIKEQLDREAPGEPVLLGGVSFGGMIALDMAGLIGASGVVLIAGCVDPSEVSARTLLAQRIGSMVPRTAWGLTLKAMALPFAKLDGLGDDDTALLRRVAGRVDVPLLDWGGGALRDWTGPEHLEAGMPVFRMHGRQDWVIPCPESGVDVVLPDGRHLINLSHEKSVNGFLAEKASALFRASALPAMA
ncbi:MAG: alpha/beta hydrolase [Planctomycetota bacterium]